MKEISVLNFAKASKINPLFKGENCAIIKAYDYGIDYLIGEGKKQIRRFLDEALLRMKGKL